MLLQNYELSACVVNAEVSTFRGVSRAVGQPVLIHILPADSARLQFWLERVREFQGRVATSPFLDTVDYQGRYCLVTGEITAFTGFAEWIGVTALPVAVPKGEVSAFFERKVSATDLLHASAPPPKRKRDYQPPQAPEPSPYSRIVKPPKPVAPPESTPEPAPPAPAPPESLAQAVEIARLGEQVRLWRMLSLIAAGLSAILFLAVLALAFRKP